MRRFLILLLFVTGTAVGQTKDSSAKADNARQLAFIKIFDQHKGALIFMDGKEYKGRIEDLKGDSIQSMYFVGGGTEIAKYGERSVNGVFVLTSKQAPFDKEQLFPPPLPPAAPKNPQTIKKKRNKKTVFVNGRVFKKDIATIRRDSIVFTDSIFQKSVTFSKDSENATGVKPGIVGINLKTK